MNPFELIQVPYFLLAEKWKDPKAEHGRISFMISSNNGYEDHVRHYLEQRDRLLNEHDDDYTSWAHTVGVYENIGGAVGHVTVFHFRIRDAY